MRVLLEPKIDNFTIPKDRGTMTYIDEKIGWKKSEYYIENGHIYRIPKTDDNNTRES